MNKILVMNIVAIIVLMGGEMALTHAARKEVAAVGPASQDVTQPEWIVIFSTIRKPVDPVLEFRILIHAKSEGDAILKCTLLIQKTFGTGVIDLLEFKEAALKPEEKR